MPTDREMFRLKNTPSGPMRKPWDHTSVTWRLLKNGKDYHLEVCCELDGLERSRRVVIGPRRARSWLKLLESAKINIFPKGYGSCDGSYSTLTTGDMYASLSLTWLNTPPEGAEVLGELEEALWSFVTPALEFGEEDVIPQPNGIFSIASREVDS